MINLSTEQINKKIYDIQKKWKNSIINIGKAYLNDKDYLKITNQFLDDLYYFDNSKVLFKPTKAKHTQFRKNKEEFISYFIAYNKTSKEDKGFALEPWKDITFENFDYIIQDNIIIAMGNYYFTNYKNKQTQVEYSFGYKFDKSNELKIIFHHSSIPFQN